MNKLKIIILAATLIFTNNSHAGDKSELACEAILCAVGIAIPASHDKCREVLIDWSVYLSTLGFFSSPPKCPKTDATGMVVGWLEMDCNLIQDQELRLMCLNARKKERNCNTLPPWDRQICECEEYNRRHGHHDRTCQLY